MARLVLHIGTPKTGSTAIQRYARAHQPYLASRGIDFLLRGRLASYNDLAISLRGGKHDAAATIATDIRKRMEESDAGTFVLSSEMFTGVDPARLRDALALTAMPETRIIGYFRRQDRYLESSYKQKMKTGKVAPGFQNYVDKFGIRGGDYRRIVDAWQAAWPEATFIFRRFDPVGLVRGDVVHDFTALLGLDIDTDGKPPPAEPANPTPSIDLLDLMQIVARIPGVDARKVFRALPVADLPRFRGRAMENTAARALLAQFADGNAALCQRFFPGDNALFATDDLDGPEPEIATPSFTDDQRRIITALLRAVAENSSGAS
ncbi:hypothetical protein [Roseovarius amoyensis]|uniref:hypothetical protein n=1 Tax=Roseovarius amoyensis TaxID=2211448 RepID=UPI000DBE5808|nr:hypothetical protein [Roseovarius amoyensis]